MKRKLIKSPVPSENVEGEPEQLLSPNRKRAKSATGTSAENHAKVEEMQSWEEYGAMTEEMQKECAKINKNDEHISKLLKVCMVYLSAWGENLKCHI